jgi:ribonuclease-3
VTKFERERLKKDVEQALGVKFINTELLLEALTHQTFRREAVRDWPYSSNQRLEFFGDSVLAIVVTQHLFHTYPKKQEGELSELRAHLVQRKALLRVGTQLDIGKFLLAGPSVSKKQRGYRLDDQLEALIGALYLDQGFEAVDRFLKRVLINQLQAIVAENSTKDHWTVFKIKSEEILKISPQCFFAEGRSKHGQVFTAKIFLDGKPVANKVHVAMERRRSKDDARQAAAIKALKIKGWWQYHR